jgi:AcrR family transcriptional regulator
MEGTARGAGESAALQQQAARSGDLLPRARIRDAALVLFAHRGASATSTRAIAAAAGVSLGAVNYHFGSKAGLIAAVNAEVLDRTREAVIEVDPALPPVEARKARRQAVHELLARSPEIGLYVRRAILAGDEEGRALFKDLYRFAKSEMEERIARGVSRPLEDPDLEPAIYLLVSSAQLFIGHYLEEMFGLDFSQRSDQLRLESAGLHLLTQPFLIARAEVDPST